MKHDRIASARARSDAWHEQHETLAAQVERLSPLRARQLAFALVTEMIAQLVAPGVPLAALLVTRLAEVVELVAEMRHRLCDVLVPASLADLGQRADRLHAWLFVQVGPRGTWPDELRLPADAAEAVRRACEDDLHGSLATLYTGARAALVRARLDVGPLDDLWQEAAREATIAGLDDLVQAAAREHKADVVLQALHVGCGAAAVDSLRRPRLADEPGLPDAGDDVPITTPEERAWCRDLAARATSGAFATKEPAT